MFQKLIHSKHVESCECAPFLPPHRADSPPASGELRGGGAGGRGAAGGGARRGAAGGALRPRGGGADRQRPGGGGGPRGGGPGGVGAGGDCQPAGPEEFPRLPPPPLGSCQAGRPALGPQR